MRVLFTNLGRIHLPLIPGAEDKEEAGEIERWHASLIRLAFGGRPRSRPPFLW
jgi:hypothetical protein